MISKSAFLAGLQCERLLWTCFDAGDQIPPPDASYQAMFDQGREVGAVARTPFADGMEVVTGITDPVEVDSASQLALQGRIRPELQAYCGLDTEGMWDIDSALRNLR